MKKQLFYSRLLIWLLRFRCRKGYGVHSPFAYSLITGVIYEKTPYYNYKHLNKIICKARKQDPALWNRSLEKSKICKLLFRLLNDAQANTILEIGTSAGASTLYLSSARKNARCVTLDEKSQANKLATRLFSSYENPIEFRVGDVPSLVIEAISELESLDFLLLHPKNYPLNVVQMMFEECMNKVNPHSVFVIRDIYASLAMRKWWKELVKDQRLGITFDLYDLGIIFFDQTKIKQHYIVNF